MKAMEDSYYPVVLNGKWFQSTVRATACELLVAESKAHTVGGIVQLFVHCIKEEAKLEQSLPLSHPATLTCDT